MLVTSLKSNAELYDVNAVPFWISRGITSDHYALLSTETPFWSWFANSLIVSVASTVISVVLSVLAAYPLARLRFAGSATFGVAIFITYLVPPPPLFSPLPVSAAPGCRVSYLRGGDLHHLPGAAFAPVPAARQRGELARSLRHAVGADRRLPDLPRSILYLAPHGILPHRTQGDRGMRHARGVRPVAGLAVFLT